MEKNKEFKILLWIVVVFAAIFFMPVGNETFMTAILATLDLAKWYAQEHVILCLLPAFFIAGVISIFVRSAIFFGYVLSPVVLPAIVWCAQGPIIIFCKFFNFD